MHRGALLEQDKALLRQTSNLEVQGALNYSEGYLYPPKTIHFQFKLTAKQSSILGRTLLARPKFIQRNITSKTSFSSPFCVRIKEFASIVALIIRTKNCAGRSSCSVPYWPFLCSYFAVKWVILLRFLSNKSNSSAGLSRLVQPLQLLKSSKLKLLTV